MDKKKIFAVAIFFLMGFFVFTFANPSEDTKKATKKSTTPENTEIVEERTNTDQPVQVNPLQVALPVVAPAVQAGPVVFNTPDEDTVKPVIELIGGDVVLRVGDEYEELGATATDDVDGNLTNKIIISGEVGTEKGTYTVTYNVSDNSGNKADEVTRTVYVVDVSLLEEALEEADVILGNDNTSTNEELNQLLEDLEEEVGNGNAIIEDETSLQDVVDDETTVINEIIEKIKNLEFNVRFVDYNDSTISEQKVKYYQNAAAPADPTRFGHTFSKWNGKYTKVVDNEVVKATYTVNTYKINYTDQLNVTNTNPTSYTVNKIEIISDLYKLGYTFGGFTYKGKTVSSTEGYAEDLSLFANWTLDNYKITLDPDNGTTLADINYTVLDTVTLPTVSKKGYKFLGWYDGETQVESIITGNYNLKAKYELINYTITYNDKYNVENTNPTSYNVENNVTFTNLVKKGYKFNGWYKNNKKITSTEGYAEALTVKANWTKENYTITYNYNGGKLPNGKKNKTTYNIDSVFTLYSPSKENYTFEGWYNGEEKVTEIKNMAGNLTLNAVYSANQTGFRAELKDNMFLQFTQGTDVNPKDYINVYAEYADGTEKLLTVDEYSINGFSTDYVGTDKTLKVVQNSNNNYSDTLTYTIVSNESFQTKFEVIYQDKGYWASNSYCVKNCDKPSPYGYYTPYYVAVNKPILEVIEHYDQYIKVNSVTVDYGTSKLPLNKTSNSVRWSHKESRGWFNYDIWNPVYIASNGNLNGYDMKDVNINAIKTVSINYTITYKNHAQKNYVVVFENRNGVFVAIREYAV